MQSIRGRLLRSAALAPLAGLALLVGLTALAGPARAQSCTLTGDVAQVSVTSGGVQNLALSRGAGVSGDYWLMIGSLSGTNPGEPYFHQAGLFLNPDPYFLRTYLGSSPFLQGGLQGGIGGIYGMFDSAGQASMQVVVPPSVYHFMVGRTVHHGFYMHDPLTLLPECGSNTIRLTFVP